MDTKRGAAKLSELLGLGVAPVAVAFRAAAPAGANRELEQYHEGRRRTIGTPGG